VYPGEFGEFIENLPRTTAQNDIVTSIGSVLGIRQGHLILDHETPLKKGIFAMKKEVQEIKEREKETLTANE
ncbi:MAG: hypothetical protein ACTSYC_09730, partial [Promethearchaeota archaeon]